MFALFQFFFQYILVAEAYYIKYFEMFVSIVNLIFFLCFIIILLLLFHKHKETAKMYYIQYIISAYIVLIY